eukprot:1404820-Pleurochrysis_carterae.AAC.1
MLLTTVPSRPGTAACYCDPHTMHHATRALPTKYQYRFRQSQGSLRSETRLTRYHASVSSQGKTETVTLHVMHHPTQMPVAWPKALCVLLRCQKVQLNHASSRGEHSQSDGEVRVRHCQESWLARATPSHKIG